LLLHLSSVVEIPGEDTPEGNIIVNLVDGENVRVNNFPLLGLAVQPPGIERNGFSRLKMVNINGKGAKEM
jgi:hypothetical protein